ncbi:MAG TPA: hypothetical protein ENO21_00495 [Firmicutes bacterium]|nr:hypothetical protein [Bacillota bacterium]
MAEGSGISPILLIVGAVTVALFAVMIAVKYIGGGRGEPAGAQDEGMSKTSLLVKLIIAGLVMFLGLAAYFLFERGGG